MKEGKKDEKTIDEGLRVLYSIGFLPTKLLLCYGEEGLEKSTALCGR